MPDPSPLPSTSRLESCAEAASFFLPWWIALATASPEARVFDDAALLRNLGLLPIAFEGLVSMGLGALMDFLPIGSRTLRTSWVAALGLGVLAWLLYRLIRACGEKLDARLSSALALAAALTAALGPFWLEGVAPGGASVAAALALASILVGAGVFGEDGRTPLRVGLLLGATCLESRAAFFAALAALAVHFVHDTYARRDSWSQAAWLQATGGILALGALPVALVIVAWARPSLGLEVALGASMSSAARFAVEGSGALRAWSAATGLFWCGFSLFGFGLGLLRVRTRRWLVPLGVLLSIDAAFSESAGAHAGDPLGTLRLLGISGLAAGGPLGVIRVMRALRHERVPFYRPVSTLLVVYAFTLAFVSAEAAAKSLDAREASAADAVTDELWKSLPPRALLLVRSEPLLLRLLASRITRGSRPDVLLVSMPHFERGGGVQARSLARDRALVPLVRDMLLSGRPSEYALSGVADFRALYVEPDLRWDTRLFAHLAPRPFFSEFVAHPLARSDRKAGLESAAHSDARVLALVQSAENDSALRAWIARGFSERATWLAALGDRELARLAVNDLLTLLPKDELGLRLKAKRDEPGHGPVALSDLAVR